MRSPHNPQASVNLGDDPDPAAELGPRLAATSQTVQGLLTNYLFYGQRRSSDRAPAAGSGLADKRGHEQQGNSARASLADHAREGVEANPFVQREVPHGLPGGGGGTAVAPGRPASAPRLELVVRRRSSAEPSAPIAADASTSPTDPLAEGALGDDPFSRGDQLGLPARDEPRRDHRQEPLR